MSDAPEYRWFAIQTTAGHENKVRSLVAQRIAQDPRPEGQRLIRQALVPVQEVVEIKNGKKTRMVSDVTYNAITTDFWQNLDAITGREHWEMFGTTGDAKGQPVQINHPSHGSPWCRIRRIMVGAAYS